MKDASGLVSWQPESWICCLQALEAGPLDLLQRWGSDPVLQTRSEYSLADAHASVARMREQDDLVGAARRVERVRLAVLLDICKYTASIPSQREAHTTSLSCMPG